MNTPYDLAHQSIFPFCLWSVCGASSLTNGHEMLLNVTSDLVNSLLSSAMVQARSTHSLTKDNGPVPSFASGSLTR